MQLVEVCAGSAAVSRHLLRAGRLLGYMGGKDGYATAIAEAWGCGESISCVHLNDPGTWGAIWIELVSAPDQVADEIQGLAERDPRSLWRHLKKASSAAERLCKLAGTHGGGEIGGFKGPHKRRPNVDGYIPSRQSLANRVRKLGWPDIPTTVTRVCATRLDVQDAWVYIDPPYQGTTGYVHQLSRQQVVGVATRLARSNRVAVSEGGPVAELTALGWKSVDVTNARCGQGRVNSRSRSEWLTISPT